jgi:hypothetical protein
MLFAALLAGCATRAIPAKFPSGSAASPDAGAAPKPVVLTTLHGDPPLPGDPSSDWAGLDATTAEQLSAGTAGPATGMPPANPATHRHEQKGH